MKQAMVEFHGLIGAVMVIVLAAGYIHANLISISAQSLASIVVSNVLRRHPLNFIQAFLVNSSCIEL